VCVCVSAYVCVCVSGNLSVCVPVCLCPSFPHPLADYHEIYDKRRVIMLRHTLNFRQPVTVTWRTKWRMKWRRH
jgi:hypothetical protein